VSAAEKSLSAKASAPITKTQKNAPSLRKKKPTRFPQKENNPQKCKPKTSKGNPPQKNRNYKKSTNKNTPITITMIIFYENNRCHFTTYSILQKL
jgi:hypothetical protein